MATVSAWGLKPGKWALDSEKQEEMEKETEMNDGRAFSPQSPVATSDFPSLSAALTKPSKKKKPQVLSFSEFQSGKSVTHGSAKAASQTRSSAGLTPDEMLVLPTGPRERTAEELERTRLGGGFRPPRDGDRRSFGGGDESGTTRWGSARASDEPKRNGGFVRDSGPSRADETDDWGATKKFTPGQGFERRDRGGLFDSQSRADESDSWVTTKSFTPSETSRREIGRRGGGFDMFQKESSNGGDSSDSWGRKKEEVTGRPKLVLQPRTAPLANGEVNGSGRNKGSNPFGEARPREEVLAEKGQDWKKIDEQLESVKIKEMGASDPPSIARRTSSPEDRTERSWRKAADSVDVVSPRVQSEKVDEGVAAN